MLSALIQFVGESLLVTGGCQVTAHAPCFFLSSTSFVCNKQFRQTVALPRWHYCEASTVKYLFRNLWLISLTLSYKYNLPSIMFCMYRLGTFVSLHYKFLEPKPLQSVQLTSVFIYPLVACVPLSEISRSPPYLEKWYVHKMNPTATHWCFIFKLTAEISFLPSTLPILHSL